MVLSSLDRESPFRGTGSSKSALLNLTHLRVEDTWRVFNPGKKFHTFVSRCGSGSRLDRVYSSEGERI